MGLLLCGSLLAGCDRERPERATAPALQRASEEHVPAAIPKIDVHVHVDLRAAELAVALFEEHGIAIALNASGGEPGRGLEHSAKLAKATAGALAPLCNLHFGLVVHPSWPQYVEHTLQACKELGGRGLKVSKYVGLGLLDGEGALVPVDDPSLDVVFDLAGRLGLPVLIHSGDPKAFFEPVTADNERYEELKLHPGWSFHGTTSSGQPYPSWHELLEQLERRVARHPETTFVGAHFGNAAEEPERVAKMLRRYPNYVIDTAARVPEFGRHDAARMRAFFNEFQNRILFGSDTGVGPGGLTLGSGGKEPGTRAQARVFFQRHWAFFETPAEELAHPTPIQGDWTVDGLGLARKVLEKVYYRNAVRVFDLKLPPGK